MLLDATIIFPNLGITIENLPNGFNIGSFHIAFYGMLIALGMILAVVTAYVRAKRTNQHADDYVDIGIISVIAGIVGARIYYVIFSLDQYTSFWQIFNIRQGGLAVYGGIIGGVIAVFFVCKYKKISFLRVMDTAAPGIAIAQAIGRWGNFFNKEAFGEYTDSFFKMQIRYSEATGGITDLMRENMVNIDGTQYIQVHPTFLYESAGCLLIFILILIFTRFQRYNGEVTLWYVGGYALLRAFVEGLRTDQLLIGDIPVSQLLSVALLAGAFMILLINRIRLIRKSWSPDFRLVLEPGDVGTKEYREKVIKERKAKKNGGSETKEEKTGEWETYTISKDKTEETEGTSEEKAQSGAEGEENSGKKAEENAEEQESETAEAEDAAESGENAENTAENE